MLILRTTNLECLINEIFKKGVIGDDLKLSLLSMCNKARRDKIIRILMNYANITTVPKKKGSRLLIETERGTFRVAVLIYISIKLIYNEKYLGFSPLLKLPKVS